MCNPYLNVIEYTFEFLPVYNLSNLLPSTDSNEDLIASKPVPLDKNPL
jgi:hypothetical protein